MNVLTTSQLVALKWPPSSFRDLDRAIRLARFSTAEILLIGEARESSIDRAIDAGADAPRPFRLNISALARISAFDRCHLSRSFSRLVDSLVFVDSLDDGTYFLNEDYRSWLDLDGTALLTPSQVAFCHELRDGPP
jgi:hypothetical protein